MDKFSLIYEFNKDSPLITYQASKELEANNYSKALDLLSTAKVKYPNHVAAQILFSLALAHKGKYEQARETIREIDKSYIESETLDFYLNQIDKIKRGNEGISVSLDDTVNEILNESFLGSENYDTDKDLDLLDDEFEHTSSGISEDIENKSIITETLAEIYASQHNYLEAIDIYEKLKFVKPDLEEKFSNRISELQQAIENKKQKKFGN